MMPQFSYRRKVDDGQDEDEVRAKLRLACEGQQVRLIEKTNLDAYTITGRSNKIPPPQGPVLDQAVQPDGTKITVVPAHPWFRKAIVFNPIEYTDIVRPDGVKEIQGAIQYEVT